MMNCFSPEDAVAWALINSDEALADATLVEDLDGPGVQTTGAVAGELLRRAAFDDRDFDLGEGELTREHQARRSATRDHHVMLVRRHAPI